MNRQDDLNTFYGILSDLEKRVGSRHLSECHGRMPWPKRGVYFFFEPGELRGNASTMRRVTRGGTHALAANSKTTLWNRLRQHRGSINPKGGDHRGSIFRLLVGEALMARDPKLKVGTWGQKTSMPQSVRLAERGQEVMVSDYLGATSLLYLSVPDAPGPDSDRGTVERNAIALLSNCDGQSPDKPSSTWLGQFSNRDLVGRSGLWNNRHTEERYDAEFLRLLEKLARQTPSN